MKIEKTRLIGMTPTELKAVITELGMPAFTAKQIAQWLYEKHVGTIEEMTNLSIVNALKMAPSNTFSPSVVMA